MKKSVKFISCKNLILLMFVGILCSCENPNLNQEDNFNKNSLAQRTSSFFENVEAIHINNGLGSGCENNILVFPSWEDFRIIVDKLDDMVELHCDDFEFSSDPNLTDEEYEALCESLGFDEDMPLIKFEDDLKFCSLRKLIFDRETDWLSQQGDGEWDSNSDPDNHFIDEIERTLFNEGVEVIIGNRNDGYILYKFYTWGHVEIHNEDYSALQGINQTGHIPNNNPNVVVVEDKREDNNNNSSNGVCRGEVVHRKYFQTGPKTRIKTVDKIKNPSFTFFTGPKIKSKTKYYRKRNLNFGPTWVRGKTTITASIQGTRYLGWVLYGCGSPGTVNITKTRKRSKVKVKETSFDQENYTLEGSLIGIHKRREDVIKNIDFYSGSVLP